MKTPLPAPNIERVNRLLQYDPATGDFTWRQAIGSQPAGARAGSKVNRWGHITIRIDGVEYMAHRLAWLLMTGTWPPETVDHRNRKGADNRWDNLRLATPSQQNGNQTLRKDNKTGARGVFFRSGKYIAQMAYGRKKVHLGVFDTMQEAKTAFDKVALERWGEFYVRAPLAAESPK